MFPFQLSPWSYLRRYNLFTIPIFLSLPSSFPKAEHILEVSVSDDGNPPLSSTTRVVIAVDDVNDHPPRFTERLYRVRIPATMRHLTAGSGGGVGGGGGGKEVDIYRVFAHDKDAGVNADIDYSIKSGRGHGR